MTFPKRFFVMYIRRCTVVILLLFVIIISTTILLLSDQHAQMVTAPTMPTPLSEIQMTSVNQLNFKATRSFQEKIKNSNIQTNSVIIPSESELRLKWIRDKVERLSRNVQKSDHLKLIDDMPVKQPNYNVHIFYYAWYKNIDIDGEWSHWNHNYLPNWKKEDKKVYPTGYHKPPVDIGSNYYPLLGCYSSRNPDIISIHMKQIRDTGIGVVVVSWTPPGMTDSPDDIFSHLLDAAEKYNLHIAPHIEPYPGRNPINLYKHICYLTKKYAVHPAFHREFRHGKLLPVYYIYDSYLISPAAWRELLSPKGNLSVRDTEYDGIFIGLLVDMQQRFDIKKSHFDGLYTYFASNGFSYGSSWKNWKNLGKFAHQHNLMFIPSVGPGYMDTAVRPWNSGNTRHRRHGQYYEVAWRSAYRAQPAAISITSFNEWHEGTQIEPAKQKSVSEYTYLDYEPEGPYFYLNLTKRWVKQFGKGDIGASLI